MALPTPSLIERVRDKSGSCLRCHHQLSARCLSGQPGDGGPDPPGAGNGPGAPLCASHTPLRPGQAVRDGTLPPPAAQQHPGQHVGSWSARRKWLAERFIRPLKEEHIDYSEYQGFDDAFVQLAYWLGVEYMTERIHSALGYLTPAEFEARLAISQPDLLLMQA